jgi:FlaA1/EpsC-like NDP-sugar epimerase
MTFFDGKRILVTGGTGSLGKTLLRRLLAGDHGSPDRITILSRDEAKQSAMRIATEDTRVHFRIGDVRDFRSVVSALRENVDIVVNAAALKQVPTCEYAPFEAVQTNIYGAENIVRAIEEYDLPVETVVGVSTDKACKPVNTMGMTKAIQERIFIHGNLRHPRTRFICVRYGNVLASRGSVVPLFHEQIRHGGPVTITTTGMTRFLLRLDFAVDTIFAAIQYARSGETYVPRAPSATVVNIARALIGERSIEIKVIGIRPGEKIHEVMVSEEEALRVNQRDAWMAIGPMLPELTSGRASPEGILKEYSSSQGVLSFEATRDLLLAAGLMVDTKLEGDLIR